MKQFARRPLDRSDDLSVLDWLKRQQRNPTTGTCDPVLTKALISVLIRSGLPVQRDDGVLSLSLLWRSLKGVVEGWMFFQVIRSDGLRDNLFAAAGVGTFIRRIEK